MAGGKHAAAATPFRTILAINWDGGCPSTPYIRFPISSMTKGWMLVSPTFAHFEVILDYGSVPLKAAFI